MRPLLPLCLLSLACAEPAVDDLFNDVEVFVEADAERTTARFVSACNSADETLHVALPAGEDTLLTDAILRAFDRGVAVEVVTDIDQAEDAGIVALMAEGVPVRLADGALTYFDFSVNADVAWTSDQTIMSHAFLVADSRRIVAATEAGSLGIGQRIVFEARGEELVEDLLIEHNQVFGGADATATTAYSGMAKSIADFRWSYHTRSDLVLELWFGPQERLTKRIIDAVYGARSSIRILTNDFANEGLADALQSKAQYGFPVQVIVGPKLGSAATSLSDQFTFGTPQVEKLRVSGLDHVPTLVLIDLETARDGQRQMMRAMALSHDIYAAARLQGGRELVSDQLIDGSLWVLNDYGDPSPELELLFELWQSHLDVAEVL